MKEKTITIEVYGGCVTEVTGLPEGYDYEIIDHDQKEAEEDAQKRSKTNNRRAIGAKQNAWTVVQPASCRMHYWRQAGDCEGLYLQRVLCT